MISDLQFIEVKSDASYEQGKQYGKQAKKVIQSIGNYKKLFSETVEQTWQQILVYASSYSELALYLH